MPRASSVTASSARAEPSEPIARPAPGAPAVAPAGGVLGLGPHDEPPTQPGRVGVLDDGGDRHGSPGLDVVGHLPELGEGLPAHLFDEDVEDAPAGQPDGIRVVVADAVALQDGHAVGDHTLGELVDRALDAARR